MEGIGFGTHFEGHSEAPFGDVSDFLLSARPTHR